MLLLVSTDQEPREAVKRKRTVAEPLVSEHSEDLKDLEDPKNPEGLEGSGSHPPTSVPGCRDTYFSEYGQVHPPFVGPYPQPNKFSLVEPQ